MENVADALKIAFAAMMFILALGLSISSFSQANNAVQEIAKMRDTKAGYTYVRPTRELTRIVGFETVIPTMYNAYKENIKIYFFDKNGAPLDLYNQVDQFGNIIKRVNFIDLSDEGFGKTEIAIEHLEKILNGKKKPGIDNEFIYPNGIYNEFKNYEFKEELGEYEQQAGMKKRIITYTKQ